MQFLHVLKDGRWHADEHEFVIVCLDLLYVSHSLVKSTRVRLHIAVLEFKPRLSTLDVPFQQRLEPAHRPRYLRLEMWLNVLLLGFGLHQAVIPGRSVHSNYLKVPVEPRIQAESEFLNRTRPSLRCQGEIRGVNCLKLLAAGLMAWHHWKRENHPLLGIAEAVLCRSRHFWHSLVAAGWNAALCAGQLNVELVTWGRNDKHKIACSTSNLWQIAVFVPFCAFLQQHLQHPLVHALSFINSLGSCCF